MALSITLRSLHSTTSINVDQLTFKKSELKFNRGNMLIYDRWMQWKSKRQMIKLDFANCINSLVESNFMKKFREQNNVICLVFGVPIKSQSKQSFENSFTLEDFGTNQHDFKFVFLTGEAINLKQFYSKIMARIHIARYWYQIAHDTKESQMFCEKQFKIISENLRLT
ncbi:hypothetical protein BLOT_008758 [Blomia tropicalis]|nr:hypothetical protein BLOT_008758 [Blomia tropicalis]